MRHHRIALVAVLSDTLSSRAMALAVMPSWLSRAARAAVRWYANGSGDTETMGERTASFATVRIGCERVHCFSGIAVSWIVSDADHLGGKPRVSGTPISVEFLLESLACGMTISEIVAEYPTLTEESVQGALLELAHSNLVSAS